MIKLWKKFFKKKQQSWKTDCYFGIPHYEKFRGHLCVSGAIIVGEAIVEGKPIILEIYVEMS